MANLDSYFKILNERFDEYLEKLRSLLMQPSISGTGEGIEDCAALVKQYIEEMGGEARPIRYEGHPIVYGVIKGSGESKPLISYGMYDVQPPDPVDKWISPPFEAEIIGNKIIARGAVNSKGPLMAFMCGLETVLEVEGKLPFDVVFVVEGEEELGSISMPRFVEDHKQELMGAGGVYFQEMTENKQGSLQ